MAGYLAKNFGRHDITLVSGDKTLGELTVNQVKYLKLFTTRLNKLVSKRPITSIS